MLKALAEGWLFSGKGGRCVRRRVPTALLAVALNADDHGLSALRQANQGRIGDQPRCRTRRPIPVGVRALPERSVRPSGQAAASLPTLRSWAPCPAGCTTRPDRNFRSPSDTCEKPKSLCMGVSSSSMGVEWYGGSQAGSISLTRRHRRNGVRRQAISRVCLAGLPLDKIHIALPTTGSHAATFVTHPPSPMAVVTRCGRTRTALTLFRARS